MNTEIIISTDKSRLDLNLIHSFLSSESYWARGRSIEKVEKSINHSLCFGVYTLENEQIGFARVVTDYSIFAWVMDVFIIEKYRSKGYSKLLLEEIFSHPELQDLQRWVLRTKDAHSLYEKYGFKSLSGAELMMEIVNKPN